jgi:hypothetical protein
MDPVTLILGGLVAGASASSQAVGSEAVKDSYSALKALIQRKLAGKRDAELVLHKYEEKPEAWKEPFKETLRQTHIDAQRLLTLVHPQQAAMGKFNVQIAGNVQGFLQGDNAHVTMVFGDQPKEK